MSFFAKIRKIVELLDETDLNHLEIRGFGYRIRVTKSANSRPRKPKKELKELEVTLTRETVVRSKFVGTFYRANYDQFEPDIWLPYTYSKIKPFVEIGNQVEVDQELGCIEAMKLFSLIKSEVKGTVKKILLEEGEPVEYGQELFIVELSAD